MRELNFDLAKNNIVTSQIILKSILGPVYGYELVKEGITNSASASHYLNMLKKYDYLTLKTVQDKEGGRVKKLYSFNFNSKYYKIMVSKVEEYPKGFLTFLYTSDFWKTKLRDYINQLWPEGKIEIFKGKISGNKELDSFFDKKHFIDVPVNDRIINFYFRNTLAVKIALQLSMKRENGYDLVNLIADGDIQKIKKIEKISNNMSKKDIFEIKNLKPDEGINKILHDNFWEKV